MTRLLNLVALLFLGALLSAQTAVVRHNVNLRPDPSINNPALAKLFPGSQLQLLEPNPTSGYFHVKTANGKMGFVWGRNVQVQSAANGPQPASPPPPQPSAGTSGAPIPLLAKGHPVDWWFVFKFNSASFPMCGGTAVRSCAFGGDVQNYPIFSQQFVFASSENHALQQGNDCLGDTTDDPLGATFDEVYNSTFHFIVWNDQFYDDPQIQGCTTYCGAPWAHSKGMLAWNDSGEGLVLQVSTPSWPAAGNALSPRRTDGNSF